MKILIDIREPPNVINRIKKYPAFASYDFSIEELPTGDVRCDDIIIERKTVHDLLASIKDNRLTNQASELRQATEFCYLVICGPLTWDYNQKIVGTEWHFRSVIGALLRVQELGVCLIHAADDYDFPATVAWILNRERDNIITLWPRTYGVPMTPDEKIISSLPGIGQDRASKLLNQYSNAVDTLLCLTDTTCDLPAGIGEKIRENVRKVLGLNENEILKKETITK